MVGPEKSSPNSEPLIFSDLPERIVVWDDASYVGALDASGPSIFILADLEEQLPKVEPERRSKLRVDDAILFREAGVTLKALQAALETADVRLEDTDFTAEAFDDGVDVLKALTHLFTKLVTERTEAFLRRHLPVEAGNH